MGILNLFRISNFGFRIFSLCSLCLCGSIFLLFFYRLGERGLWSSHEARAAQDAQSVLNCGDWRLPRLYDERPELQKPPLFYCLVAVAARLRGGQVDAWAVRLPAASAALGCVGLLYLLARSLRRRWMGLTAAAVLATALHFTWLARVGRIDMPLTFTVAAALLAYYRGQCIRHGRRDGRVWPWFLAAYLAVAAAVLLKGPIGIVLPGIVVLFHLAFEGEFSPSAKPGTTAWRRVRKIGHELGVWWGIPLVAVLTVPWFWWANVHTGGELFRVFFWYHNIERGFGGSGKLAEHPWWFYGPRFALDFLPWTPALLLAIWYCFRRRGVRLLPTDPEARFGLLWLGGMIVLLSCMRFKRADYLLPAYPGAALFLGAAAERWYLAYRPTAPRKAWVFGPLAFALTVSGCVLGWWVYVAAYLPGADRERGYQLFAAEIRRRAPAPEPIILFRTKPHALTFHLGRPVDTLLEWENLDWWAGRPNPRYVVMPPELARECPRRVKSGRLVEVLRSTDLASGGKERALVLLRTQSHSDHRAR
jgi:4-amino-4-deoxy-L-arabinose transferase-like glycosyltransferase